MASNYDSVDMEFTWDGDYAADDTGDIRDTSTDHLASLVTEVRTIIKSAIGDWRDNQEMGADLDDFIGEPNTRAIAEAIKARVISALSIIVRPVDLDVRVLPVHMHRVLILVKIFATPTPNNKLTAFEPITVHFIFDYQENGLYIPANSLEHFNNIRDEV